MIQIAAIVTQPPSRKYRGQKLMPSPVAQHALDRGFPSDLIFTPMKAGEVNYILQVFWFCFCALCNFSLLKFLTIIPIIFIKLDSICLLCFINREGQNLIHFRALCKFLLQLLEVGDFFKDS